MDVILTKIIKGEKITDEDLENELYEICSTVHAGCDSQCPIYDLVLTREQIDQLSTKSCPYFKSGKKMLAALIEEFAKKRRVSK